MMNDQFGRANLPARRGATSPDLIYDGDAFDHWGEAPERESKGLDLRALWAIAYRNRLLVTTVMIVALLAGVASILLTAPSYKALATLQVEQQITKVLGTEDDVQPPPSAAEAERFLQTQVDILESRSLARQVSQALNLPQNERFWESVGLKRDGQSSKKTPEALVMEAIDDRRDVNLPRNTRIVEVGFESRDPVVSAMVANAYAENFISSNLQRRFDASSYSRDFLEGQLAQAKTRLEAAERAMISYARSARLIDASAGSVAAGQAEGPRSLTTANLVQLNQAYVMARSNRIQTQQRWEQVQRTPVMSLPEVLENSTIQKLTESRAVLEAQYQEELERRKPDHPAVRQAAARIEELDRQISSIAGSIKNSVRDKYLVALRQESSLQGNVGQLKAETLSEQDRGVQYGILKREAETSRELYDGLLQRYKELSAAAGITVNNISIIDRAEPPAEAVSPKPLLNMAFSGFAGLCVAFLLVFVRERLDDSVRMPDDVEAKLQLPLLGVVPRLKAGLVFQDELNVATSPVSEAYHSIRTTIELSSPAGTPSSILLTSSRPAEGKSSTAYALARDFARGGKRVVLIDADLRRPSLHRVLALAHDVGLSHLLAQQKLLEEVIVPTSIENLDFISSGPRPPNPADLLARDTFRRILVSLQDRYDIVIVDGPPVLGLADAPRLAALVQGTIFVIEANGAHRGQGKAALRRLASASRNVLGAILTKFDAQRSGYGAAYGYSYYAYGDELEVSGSKGNLKHLAAED